ncbi:peroxisomal oxidase [Mycena pura]|uniref:Peroxisomal oxidase n=1 Tax=Mycena pura TaxID=153505 RepID=A0AAD6YR58_9AGAR|nr:peroxisomal oxidase [Mycena pura]
MRGVVTSISVSDVRHFLHNGAAHWRKRDQISQNLSSDPLFDKSQRTFATRKELYIQVHRWSFKETNLALSIIDVKGLPQAVGLHNVAFEPVLRLQASPELLSKYGALVASKGILGCYLQTELGHGTKVGHLETTATYIPETREFEIHSPTLSSTKWWIGALGKTATHGVVQAKLILPGGKDTGPHLFFVQLRCLVIGGIGPKALAGYPTTDNGFARFDHLSYGGMLYIRSGMVTGAGWLIGKVRRRGEIGPDGLERQIITYLSLNVRLIPVISHAYVFVELGHALTRGFNTLARDLSSGDTSQLAEMHMMTSGLKVLVSTTGVGAGRMYADYVPAVTYEGENYVLDGQVLRAALKSFLSVVAAGAPTTTAAALSPTSYYLRLLLVKNLLPPELSPASWKQPATTILLLEWRAALLVHESAQTIGQPDTLATQRVSRAVTEAFVAARVGEMIQGVGNTLKPREADVVKKVYLLYLLTTVKSALGTFRSRDPTRELRLAVAALCGELLPEAIGLTDAFGFSDWELDSALGVYDGRAFEALWKKVQEEPLNQMEVTEAYEFVYLAIQFREFR